MSDFLTRLAARAVASPDARPAPPTGMPFETTDPPDAEPSTAPERVSVAALEPATPVPAARVEPAAPAPGPRRTKAPSIHGREPDRTHRDVPAVAAPTEAPAPRRDDPAETVTAAAAGERVSVMPSREQERRTATTAAAPVAAAAPAPVVVEARPAPAPPVVLARPVPAVVPAAPAAPVPVAAPVTADDTPAVRIHIGRLEVRAALEETSPPRPAPSPHPATGLSLSDYLKGEGSRR